jgi:aldose sugar dehydrogenase
MGSCIGATKHKQLIMKSIFTSLLVSLVCIAAAQTPDENFAPKRVVNAQTPAGRFRHPFAMIMGPGDSLWITERRGFIVKIDRINGQKKTLLNITSTIKFTTSNGGNTIAQDGMLGIAIHPEMNKGTGNDFVYTAYCYDSAGLRRVKLVRFTYGKAAQSPFGDTLLNETTLLQGIPGSNDHNGGKLAIGNFGTAQSPNYKLMYSVGDRGANQFGNACDSIQSLYLPSQAELNAGNLLRYNGKILRLNLDGSIPADNPLLAGVKSHIWSYGHRNPQGLVFETDEQRMVVPGGKLYSSEMGPAANDEVNIIDSANNYGWPRIAGKKDDVWYKYYNWSASTAPNPLCTAYSSECSATQTNLGLTESSYNAPRLTNPIFDLYPGAPPTVNGVPNTCFWLTYPTLAPSSIAYYPYSNRIPGWDKCLLIATLKSSAIYRLKLNSAGNNAASVSDSVIQYFRDNNALNRFRDIVVGSDGLRFFVLTDSVGATSGPSGNNASITDRGCVLEYVYTGNVLTLGNNNTPGINNNYLHNYKIYPNPARDVVFVENRSRATKPIRYSILDAAGRVMITGSSIRDRFTIPVQLLAKGIYYLRLMNTFGINEAVQKIIIQ